MSTRELFPAGHLQVGSKQWILIFTYGKTDNDSFSFRVVSPKVIADRTDVDEFIYPSPYTLEVHGDWFIEYDINKSILVQVSEDEND